MTIATSQSALAHRERLFYAAMGASMLLLVVIGFGRTFFFRAWFPEAAELAAPERIFLVHGVFFTAWMLLLVAQTALVSAGRVALHRRFGALGIGLAVVMVALGLVGAMIGARRPEGFIGVPVPPLQFLAVPVFDMLLFGTFVGLALAWRHSRQHHKRLMLLATINLLGAAVVRIPLVTDVATSPLILLLLPSLLLVPLALWDLRTLGRIHPVTLWAGLATVASQPLRLTIMDTGPWLAVAGWAVGSLD